MTAPADPPRCRNGACMKMAPGLCRPCADRLGRWLDELPGYVTALTDTPDLPCCDKHAAPPPPRGARGALALVYEATHPNPAPAGDVRPAATVRVGGSRERPLPGGADRLSWLSRAADVAVDASTLAGAADAALQTGRTPVGPALASWVQLAAEELGVHLPPAGAGVSGPDGLVLRCASDDVPTLIGFLTRWHPELVKQPWSDDYAIEVHDQWSTARRLTGEAEQWVRIGACTRPLDDGDPCGEVLSARPEARVIRCAGCGADWARELWLLLGATIEGVSA